MRARNECCSQRPGGGRGILFAGVFLQMDAVRLLPLSRDPPHGSLGLKAESPKYPSGAVCCSPSHGHTCGGPAWVLFVAIALQGMWRCSEAHWLSLASGHRHPARLRLVRHSECDALAEVAAVELGKKINIPHHTSETWPAEMLMLSVTGVSCGHSFRAAGWW